MRPNWLGQRGRWPALATYGKPTLSLSTTLIHRNQPQTLWKFLLQLDKAQTRPTHVNGNLSLLVILNETTFCNSLKIQQFHYLQP